MCKSEEFIMAKSKSKREKPVETAEEFAKRVNQQNDKRNGLKRRTGRHHQR